MENQATEFFKWLKRYHPEIVLHPWQEEFIKQFYSHAQATGKSFLLDLINKFERT